MGAGHNRRDRGDRCAVFRCCNFILNMKTLIWWIIAIVVVVLAAMYALGMMWAAWTFGFELFTN